ncbi:hypothetical protein M9435_005516 [Picochlorum sp. BPE23]|nr:hypothetical protein M9435_005516 [Picochlorum sp. BPE23]
MIKGIVRAKSSDIDEEIHRVIESDLGFGSVEKMTFFGGSSWSSCYLCETSQGKKVFAKTARGRKSEDMFLGEYLGLKAMFDTGALRIPDVYQCGDAGTGSFILMEYLKLNGGSSQALLGESLARMHLSTPSHPKAQEGFFGFDVDNTIGGTPQPNPWTDTWLTFFKVHRLQHQLRLAGDKNLSVLGEKLCNNLEVFFPADMEIKPCTLHGDLWSGNIASVEGKPCLIDPAAYYGHSEAEFGMSWCAGFGKEFYDAYHALIPRAPGFSDRHDLYTLYHMLNHYNLFGGGYYGQCENLLKRLVSKI